MCFNISMQLKKARMEERFNAVYPDDLPYEERFHTSAFERPTLPVLTNNQADKFQLMTWGLIPGWAKSEKDALEISLKTMNAKAETLTDKPSFRQVAKTNRCLIPVTGFFEWQQVNSKKIPWFISLKDEDAFSLAGIWSEWVNPTTGELKKTFSVITTEANGLMAKIHNTKKRMPVILTQGNEKSWIDEKTSISMYSNILKPLDDDKLQAYTVSPLVSNPRNNRNVPEVLKEYNYESAQQKNLFFG